MSNTTQQICVQCASPCTVTNSTEYAYHMSTIKRIVEQGKPCPRNYPYISWMYACEAYEIEHNLPRTTIIATK